MPERVMYLGGESGLEARGYDVGGLYGSSC